MYSYLKENGEICGMKKEAEPPRMTCKRNIKNVPRFIMASEEMKMDIFTATANTSITFDSKRLPKLRLSKFS